MNELKEKSYKDFDNFYEEQEVSPYNAAQDYFNAGWDSALKSMETLFADRLTGDIKASEIIGLFRSIKKELSE